MPFIGRILEAHGYGVCIISQPDWKDEKSIDVLWMPKAGFLISAGCIVHGESLAVQKASARRSSSPGEAGKRPGSAGGVL